MRLRWKGFIAAFVIAAPAAGFAASCTSQAELTPQDRGTLASIGEQLSDAVLRQDLRARRRIRSSSARMPMDR